MMKAVKESVLCMLLSIFCFLPVMGFDAVREMDNATRDPGSAYTLYMGMPVAEFNDNFHYLPGWTRLTDTHWGNGVNSIVFVRSDHHGSYVKEELAIGISNGKVFSYSVLFRTESKQLAEQLQKTGYTNLSGKLGAAVFHAGNTSQKKIWDWYLDSHTTDLQLMSSESSLAIAREEEKYIVSVSRAAM